MKNNKSDEHDQPQSAELQAFYDHFTAYSGMMAVLFLIDLVTGIGWWFHWPLFAWGMGIAAHGISAFGCSMLSDPTGEA